MIDAGKGYVDKLQMLRFINDRFRQGHIRKHDCICISAAFHLYSRVRIFFIRRKAVPHILQFLRMFLNHPVRNAQTLQ